MKAYLAIAVPERAPRARILAALCAMLPRVGVADDGAFVCDLRGTERLLGTPLRVARNAISACAAAGGQGLAAGVGTTPFVARVAASRLSAGKVSEIPAGGERAFLDVLPLDVLPLDPKVIEELALLGVRRIGEFLALTSGAVTDRFGHAAAIAYALATGELVEDVRGVAPHRRIRAKRMWDDPVDSRERLIFALRAAADELAEALRHDGLAALRIRLVLEREELLPLRLERSLLPPSAESAAIVRSLRWGLEEIPMLGLVASAALEITAVEPARGRQIGLFAPDGAHAEEAISVAQFLRTRLGAATVLQPRVIDADARLPERAAEWEEVVR
jgi:nucleotidyltransferase/DNA polymerase involved in DNA repair